MRIRHHKLKHVVLALSLLLVGWFVSVNDHIYLIFFQYTQVYLAEHR